MMASHMRTQTPKEEEDQTVADTSDPEASTHGGDHAADTPKEEEETDTPKEEEETDSPKEESATDGAGDHSQEDTPKGEEHGLAEEVSLPHHNHPRRDDVHTHAHTDGRRPVQRVHAQRGGGNRGGLQ